MALAQGLFHARGFDGVSVQEITTTLGIQAPSFYAAFGSKMALYQQVLARYGETTAIPLPQLLRSDALVADCLAAVLEEGARRYATRRPPVAWCWKAKTCNACWRRRESALRPSPTRWAADLEGSARPQVSAVNPMLLTISPQRFRSLC